MGAPYQHLPVGWLPVARVHLRWDSTSTHCSSSCEQESGGDGVWLLPKQSKQVRRTTQEGPFMTLVCDSCLRRPFKRQNCWLEIMLCCVRFYLNFSVNIYPLIVHSISVCLTRFINSQYLDPFEKAAMNRLKFNFI